MVLFEDIVISTVYSVRRCWRIPANNYSLAHPWEGAENRNDDKNVSNDTTCDHSRMLYSPVSYNVDDLINKPAADRLARSSLLEMVKLTLRRIVHSPSEHLLDAATPN